jgi:hypothetical protein
MLGLSMFNSIPPWRTTIVHVVMIDNEGIGGWFQSPEQNSYYNSIGAKAFRQRLSCHFYFNLILEAATEMLWQFPFD